jgi:phosphoglucosamine mutase
MDINVGCGSTHLGPVTDLVREAGADLGVAHDGDADRVLAVDETGAEVDGDMIMAITAASMQEAGKLPLSTVVSTVMANIGFELAMKERGISVIKTKVGDRYVLEQLQTSGAMLGGEQSGHIIFLEHNTTGDGLVTALQLASVMKATGKTASELRSVMRRFPQVLVNVPVADKTRLATSAVLADAIHEIEGELGESGRVLVRASGTEPLVRVMAEASDAETAADVVDRLVEIVKAELG